MDRDERRRCLADERSGALPMFLQVACADEHGCSSGTLTAMCTATYSIPFTAIIGTLSAIIGTLTANIGTLTAMCTATYSVAKYAPTVSLRTCDGYSKRALQSSLPMGQATRTKAGLPNEPVCLFVCLLVRHPQQGQLAERARVV